MSATTEIAWTDSTWNPVRGCTKVSAGCKICYAERFAERFRGVHGHPFEQGFDLRLVPEALDLPLRWRKPRRVFVNSMSDLFHEDVPDEFIAAVFGVMAAAPQHTFQILTKRAERLPRWFAWVDQMARRAASVFGEDPLTWRRAHILRAGALRQGAGVHKVSAGDMEARGWPLPNVWLGVSVEDQRAANERIPKLLATPAAVRFLACEPLLGPVDLVNAGPMPDGDCLGRGLHNWGTNTELDWVIVGGESGPGARPMNLAWAGSLVAQCRAAAVPVFVKQLGAHPYERAEILGGEGHAGKDLLGVMTRPALPAQREGWTRVTTPEGEHLARYWHLRDRKGGDPAEWPEDLRVREMPEPA